MNQHPPLANTITLGVQDISVEREFYRQLGWPLLLDSEDFVVFELRGALLALFPFEQLAADARAKPDPGSGGIRFSVIIVADGPEDLDHITEAARRAGGRVTKAPADAEFFPGRSTYFADPEGNFWEVAWMPQDNPVVDAARRAASGG